MSRRLSEADDLPTHTRCAHRSLARKSQIVPRLLGRFLMVASCNSMDGYSRLMNSRSHQLLPDSLSKRPSPALDAQRVHPSGILRLGTRWSALDTRTHFSLRSRRTAPRPRTSPSIASPGGIALTVGAPATGVAQERLRTIPAHLLRGHAGHWHRPTGHRPHGPRGHARAPLTALDRHDVAVNHCLLRAHQLLGHAS